MRIAAQFGLAAAMAALSAGAQDVKFTQLTPYKKNIVCNAPVDGNCPVAITVDADACKPAADPPILVIPRKGTANIFFDLGGDWVFDKAKGVAFYATNNSDQFECKMQTTQRFKCQDKGAKSGYYGYEINVVSKDGKKKCSVDPGVWNDFPEGP